VNASSACTQNRLPAHSLLTWKLSTKCADALRVVWLICHLWFPNHMAPIAQSWISGGFGLFVSFKHDCPMCRMMIQPNDPRTHPIIGHRQPLSELVKAIGPQTPLGLKLAHVAAFFSEYRPVIGDGNCFYRWYVSMLKRAMWQHSVMRSSITRQVML
jgi:hypothetical protein